MNEAPMGMNKDEIKAAISEALTGLRSIRDMAKEGKLDKWISLLERLEGSEASQWLIDRLV